jgi:CoA:oxalate CoA-transferase
MEKLGYGWDGLHARFPRLLYVAASGFGHTGPCSSQPSYDMVVQGLGGIMSITGHPGQPPIRIGMSIGDIGAGLYAAVAVNAALLHRERTGEATKIDVAMFDCQLALLENAVLRYTTTGKVPGPMGARHPSITPFEAIETGDGYMIVAAGNDGLYRKLCAAIERPELASDPRFLTNDLRSTNGDKLRAVLGPIFRAKPTAAWIALLEAAGVPCGPINDVAQALAHPQVAARNMLVEIDDPAAGRIRVAGNPMKLSAFADPPKRPPAPELDASRAAILGELGLSA